MAEELKGVTWARDRVRSLIRQLVDRESRALADLRCPPGPRRPAHPARRAVRRDRRPARPRAPRVRPPVLARAHDDVTHQRARARALSPLATLERGYAVVQRTDGAASSVVTSVADVSTGVALSIRVADGRIAATTTDVEAEPIEESHG